MSPTHHVMFDLQRRGQTFHVYFHNLIGILSFLRYGALTLNETDTYTEADTDEMGAVPSGSVFWYRSLYSMNISLCPTKSVLAVGVGFGQCEHTISVNRCN